MKFYLSSFRLGNDPTAYFNLFKENKSVGVICNAIDDAPFNIRREKVMREINWLKEIGLNPKEIDLREFFNSDKLERILDGLGGIWIRGGNTFILRRAFSYSKLDQYILNKLNTDFVYGGYSAGVVVLMEDLHGIEIIDPIDVHPEGYDKNIIWNGLGLIDYSVAVHYRSDHPKSYLVEDVVNLWDKEGRRYKTMRDGDVIIIEKTK
jgi:dipeptidase E